MPIRNYTEQQFLERFEGFWLQKPTAGCVQPAASYQVLASCLEHKLYLFAEQNKGASSISLTKATSSSGKNANEVLQKPSVFQSFDVNVVSKDAEETWNAQQIKQVGSEKMSQGAALCFVLGQNALLLFQFGGIMAMTTSKQSCKLADQRLICTDIRTAKPQVIEYSGDIVEGRKSAALSSPENFVEEDVRNQKVFIFGGYNTMYKFINDEGYFMYNIGTREMEKIAIKNPEAQKLLLRS